ncbi:MAG: hypothetical protein AB7O24_27260 [Kofleriaceae bacterium]
MRTALLLALLGTVGCVDGGGGDNDTGDPNGKADSGDEQTIAVGGQRLRRIAPRPMAPADQAKVDTFMGGFLAAPVTDFRTQAAAEVGIDLAVTDVAGEPVRLGSVAYLRPGLGNIAPSPADVFLLARHFDTLVVLYTNTTDASGDASVRRVTEIAGVTIPDRIAGEVNIFAIGSPQFNLITSTQQSDVTLEQLQQLHDASTLVGFDALEEPAWIFAHSQGSIDAVLTDDRLRDAGFAGFDHIVTIGAALEGGRLIRSGIGASWISGALAAAGTQGATAMEALAPDLVAGTLTGLLGVTTEQELASVLAERITFSFAGAIDTTAPKGNVRDAFLFLAGQADGAGRIDPSDGVVSTTSALKGGFTKSYPQTDHVLLIEDPALLADMLSELD